MTEPEPRTLTAAQGYAELGMLDDALAELDTLPLEQHARGSAGEMRVAILVQAKRWADALGWSEELCRNEPERKVGFIHAAFCLHELGRTGDARDLLLSGPTALHDDPTYHYNLACYECQLGQLELARAHLERSFQLDKKFRAFAKKDPDLKALDLP